MTVTSVTINEAAEVRLFFELNYSILFILLMESVKKNQMRDGVVSALSTVRVVGADLTNVVAGEGQECDVQLCIQRFVSQRVNPL